MLTTMVIRSLLNNARISAWTLMTLTTCAVLVTLFTTVTFEVGRKMRGDLRRLGANAVAYSAASSSATDWTAFANVARGQGASFVLLSTRVGLIDGKAVAVVAVDPRLLQQLTSYWAVTGTRPSASNECLIGHHIATALRLKVAQVVHVDNTELRVVGITETGDEDDDRLFVTGTKSDTPAFTYALTSVAGGEQEVARLQQALAATHAGVEVKPLRQVLHGEKQVLDKINVLFVATLGAVLVLTALGVSASMLARVVERRKEFALLQALGAKRRAVVKFLLAESATVGVMAAVAGFVIGTVLASVVVRQIFHASVGPQWAALAAALGTTTLVSLLAGGIACGRTLRFQPAAALRGE